MLRWTGYRQNRGEIPQQNVILQERILLCVNFRGRIRGVFMSCRGQYDRLVLLQCIAFLVHPHSLEPRPFLHGKQQWLLLQIVLNGFLIHLKCKLHQTYSVMNFMPEITLRPSCEDVMWYIRIRGIIPVDLVSVSVPNFIQLMKTVSNLYTSSPVFVSQNFSKELNVDLVFQEEHWYQGWGFSSHLKHTQDLGFWNYVSLSSFCLIVTAPKLWD